MTIIAKYSKPVGIPNCIELKLALGTTHGFLEYLEIQYSSLLLLEHWVVSSSKVPENRKVLPKAELQ